MGIMGAVGAGLAEAGGAAAEIGFAKVKSAIEEDRAARLAELQSEIRVREAKTTSADRWNETVERAPAARDIKTADTTATEQARKDVELDPTNIEAESYKAGILAEGKAEAEVAAMIKKSTPEALAAARKIAAATRDPAQQRLLGIQIAEAQLKLDEGKTQAGERKQVRGLMSAAADVDTSQPGAAEAKEFYKKEAKEAEKGAQLAKGVDVDKADRSTYLALAKEKYDLANKEMDPERKDKLIGEGDAYAAAAEGKQGMQTKAPVTKVINGVTWTKVPGGWKKATP